MMATADACDTQRVACGNKESMSYFCAFNLSLYVSVASLGLVSPGAATEGTYLS